MSADYIQSWYGISFANLQKMLEEDGLSSVHARTLWRALYRRCSQRPVETNHFVPPLKRWAETKFDTAGQEALRPKIRRETASTDRLTRKYLLELRDGATIETVLMGYPGRQTACLSTQVGCAMGCVFCATGQMGFTRNLTAAEIVEQVLIGRGSDPGSAPGGLRNLVLMGMGEPLHNYDAVMTALEIITDTGGINIGPSRITISTVGLVPAINRMAEERRPYNLAVSLHGATEADRAALVPVSRRWPLQELIDSCRFYGNSTGRRIFFEWTLISDVNDSPEQANALVNLLKGIDAHLNIIPLNQTAGYGGNPANYLRVERFRELIRCAGIPCTIRQRRGLDVAAGCGQLKREEDLPFLAE